MSHKDSIVGELKEHNRCIKVNNFDTKEPKDKEDTKYEKQDNFDRLLQHLIQQNNLDLSCLARTGRLHQACESLLNLHPMILFENFNVTYFNTMEIFAFIIISDVIKSD